MEIRNMVEFAKSKRSVNEKRPSGAAFMRNIGFCRGSECVRTSSGQKGLCRVDSDSDQTVMSDNDVGRLCSSPLFHLAESFPVWHTSSIQAITYYNDADRVVVLLAMAEIGAV
ncbi:hypothetical protein HZH68_009557 [Vespula germanica]|uniref:Uncharacterized protein n=2 Tax=Vespula TaxID=7451 RepID=A0A834N421_VESGE|nr:hypothetical protein HZH68_009557 [Vespula germanica]